MKELSMLEEGYEFLNNDYEFCIIIGGQLWGTVDHYCNRIDLVNRERYMLKALRTKFNSSILKNKLISTGNTTIINYNTIHNNVLGDCTCDGCKDIEGENLLGKLIMKVREEIKQPPTGILDWQW